MRRRTASVLAVGVLLAAVAGAAAYRALGESARRAAVREAARRMGPDIDACRARLALFHQAWRRYRDDHQGAAPPSVEALVPAYVSSGRFFACPAAVRCWEAGGGRVPHGTLRVGRRLYPVTYGFRWLSGGDPRRVAALGERAPLVVCSAHREILYAAAYSQMPPLGAFDPPTRRRLYPEVAAVPLLAVSRDGTVAPLSPSQE